MKTKADTAVIIVLLSFMSFIFHMPELALILAAMACLAAIAE